MNLRNIFTQRLPFSSLGNVKLPRRSCQNIKCSSPGNIMRMQKLQKQFSNMLVLTGYGLLSISYVFDSMLLEK